MKILVAEDNGVYRRLLEQVLKQWGYSTLVAVDGEEAWKILQNPDAPKLAIIDWMMPGLEGVEIIRRVRALDRPRYTYILLLTSRAEINDVEIGLYAGSDDYLTKPFELPELKARLFAGTRVLQLHDQLRETIKKLDLMASQDSLTQLLNRAAIVHALRDELERARRSETPVSALMIDVDFFKQINDTKGHPAGDAVLGEVARRIRSAVRSYDAVGRYGGEEFLVCLPGCNVFAATEIAERVRLNINKSPILFQGSSLMVSVSVGISVSRQGSDWEQMVRFADQALYSAKHTGRNRVCLYSNRPPAKGQPAEDDKEAEAQRL